jgi:hypothetical protein
MNSTYTSPVNQLLTYGDCRESQEWPNYLELGLTRDHIPELIRMATDEELNWADSDGLEVWAPVHAWRTLGQLRAEEAIEPLMSLFHELEENDWVGEELPIVYGMIGVKAIPALAMYLADSSHGIYPRLSAAHGLERIGDTIPAAREECVSILTRQLGRFTEQAPDFNALLIAHMIDLKAVESISSIRKAYEEDCVDYAVYGDIEDVEIELGLRSRRSTPANYPTLADRFFPGLKAVVSPQETRKKDKVGRNEPCPCGSGKKYKKCCLNKPKESVDTQDSSPKQIELSASEEQEIRSLLNQGKRVQAMQRVVKHTGAGLKAAKDYIDHLR